MKEKQPPLIFESQFFSGHGKWLAGKSRSQNVDGLKAILFDAQVLDALVDEGNAGKVELEGLFRKSINLVRPRDLSPDFLEGATEPADGGEQDPTRMLA